MKPSISDTNTLAVASGRSQVTYEEDSWSCSLGLVRNSKPCPLLRMFIYTIIFEAKNILDFYIIYVKYHYCYLENRHRDMAYFTF